MDFLTWGRSPWDQPILTHLSWDLLWASLFAGVVFFVAHASYMVLSAHRKRHADETDAMEAALGHLPERITRHSLVARLFHRLLRQVVRHAPGNPGLRLLHCPTPSSDGTPVHAPWSPNTEKVEGVTLKCFILQEKVPEH